jgi:hypothetical protein
MIFSVTGIELVFLDHQVFLAQTKKASVLEIERKFVFVLKKRAVLFYFLLAFGHTEIHSCTTNLSPISCRKRTKRLGYFDFMYRPSDGCAAQPLHSKL